MKGVNETYGESIGVTWSAAVEVVVDAMDGEGIERGWIGDGVIVKGHEVDDRGDGVDEGVRVFWEEQDLIALML